ncbi:UDP-N-acetylmuramate dehydrogenase [Sphingobacterium sp. SRCM116780]|uniref:UDP-N-acetylmuramate dehydrogenase n=1 Tax=Sphingobacterium sp. SRCM116780 TaxID=2907623 RepID=UPI001F3176B5|nr:UDP-N-acetylmuramate dehydrogenase [Sphingobacterium sp. SRCM116780]UIR56649.1 UDP-N-acetylmuramate dehydrogenase [Sphingobacterium sp. SRCM116780]
MGINIQSDVSLKKYNTFGIEEIATNFIEITDPIQLLSAYETGIFKEEFLTLGGGSNILFTKPYSGYIIKINNKGIQAKIVQQDIFITACAGEIWNDLVCYCINNNYNGLENMALIPGTVGASPVQNIGAYGTELMNIFYSCIAFDTVAGIFKVFYNEDCQFSYRDSIFKSEYKGRYIITEVTYKLSSSPSINTSYGAISTELEKRQISNPTIRDIAEVVSYIRVEKLPDPSTVGNAGSFFKNPVISIDKYKELKELFPDLISYTMPENKIKLAAGWLIEQCGWKGKVIGQAGVWKNQALVLINIHAAKGTEIFELSSKIINDVYQKFNVKLEREVNIF